MISRYDGPSNMAMDAELLARAELLGETGVRVYGWSGPWITLGMFQAPERDLLPTCPVPYVSRPTGGRAVLHGHDVTVGFAEPLSRIAPPGTDPATIARSMRTVYRHMVSPLIRALRAVGVMAELGESFRARTQQFDVAPRSSDCFAHAANNDVVHEVTGFKICGCALRVTDRGALVQASIPAGPPLVDPALVYSSPAPVHYSSFDADEFLHELLREVGR